MAKIYVPTLNNSNCVVIQTEGVLRVYDNKPQSQGNYTYTEYFINNHYISRTGSQNFGNMGGYPSCINNNVLTTDYFYRDDLFDILGCFLILLIICFYFPYKIISRMFGRWLKL